MFAAWSASSLDMIGDGFASSVVVLEPQLSKVARESRRLKVVVDEVDETWLLTEEAGLNEGEERSGDRASFVVAASSCSIRARSVVMYSMVP